MGVLSGLQVNYGRNYDVIFKQRSFSGSLDMILKQKQTTSVWNIQQV